VTASKTVQHEGIGCEVLHYLKHSNPLHIYLCNYMTI